MERHRATCDAVIALAGGEAPVTRRMRSRKIPFAVHYRFPFRLAGHPTKGEGAHERSYPPREPPRTFRC